MDKQNFEDPSHNSNKKDRSIIDIQEDWPLWQRISASIINFSPVFIWTIITIFLLHLFSGNTELVGFRDAYLNIVVPAAAYGVGTLIAGVSLFGYLFPYFSYRRIMRNGTPLERSMCMGLWGMIAIAIAIVIASVA